MPKITVNISEDAIIILRAIAAEQSCSYNSVVTQALTQMALRQDGNTLRDISPFQDELKRLRAIAASNEKQLAVLYGAFNNFLLQFAADPDEFVSPQTELHEWIVKSEQQYIDQVKQKAHQKKWMGDVK